MAAALRLLLAFGIAAAVHAPPAAALVGKEGQALATAAEHRVQYDRYGAVVRSATGRRFTFSRDQISSRGAAPADSGANSAAGTRAGTLGEGGGPLLRPAWTYAAFGSGVGLSNIAVARNGNQTEIYLGGSGSTFSLNTYWHALRYEPTSKSYRQVHVSSEYSVPISRIVVGDVVGDQRKEIIVGLADGRIMLYDQATKAPAGEIATGATSLRGLAVADLDGRGKDLLVATTDDRLYVYSGDGVPKWDYPISGGADVVIGQMDADPGLEIAVSGGQVIDWDSKSVQWAWRGPFGRNLKAADIDGDGMDELIAAEDWYVVWAYNVDRQLPKWSIPTDHDIGAIQVADVDKDGVPEVLVGDGQWGYIHAYNPVTLAEKWSVLNPEHGVTSIAVGDVDQDGKTEILWGAGATSTGPDHLYVVDWASKSFEWTSPHLDGPFIGPERGDLDGDGIPEIVVVSRASDSDYGSGRIVVFSESGQLRGMSAPIANNLAWTGTHDLKLRDVDRDGKLDIVVAADYLYDGVIEAYGFDAKNNFTLKWTNATRPSGSPFFSVEVADIDGDGIPEVIGGGGRIHTGATGTFVYVYDGATGGEKWHSMQLGNYWDVISGLSIVDTDGDKVNEIVAMISWGDAYIFDGRSKDLEAFLTGPFSALSSGLYAGAPALYLGDLQGYVNVRQYLRGNYPLKDRRQVSGLLVSGITFAPDKSIWTGSDGILSVFSPTWRSIWSSEYYGDKFGSRTSFSPRCNMFYSAGGYSVVAFINSLYTSGPWTSQCQPAPLPGRW